MYHPHEMADVYNINNCTADGGCRPLRVIPLGNNPVKKLPSGTQLHDKVHRIFILIGPLEFDNICLPCKVLHDLDLPLDVLPVALIGQLPFRDGFAGVTEASRILGAEIGHAELATAQLLPESVQGPDILEGLTKDGLVDNQGSLGDRWGRVVGHRCWRPWLVLLLMVVAMVGLRRRLRWLDRLLLLQLSSLWSLLLRLMGRLEFLSVGVSIGSSTARRVGVLAEALAHLSPRRSQEQLPPCPRKQETRTGYRLPSLKPPAANSRIKRKHLGFKKEEIHDKDRLQSQRFATPP
ncbi:hypothetical protein B296_00034367 [Ensete ventricosum]|uniref:Uncharacterized protein n=1 Tax=Ensete ventricosum TaxID=4639 RepID=A0A426YP90_ENSVE|nr:hypothetical protein B296_00034367 [Ensete ventricosum]